MTEKTHFLHSQKLGIWLLSRKETQRFSRFFSRKISWIFPLGPVQTGRPPLGEGGGWESSVFGVLDPINPGRHVPVVATECTRRRC